MSNSEESVGDARSFHPNMREVNPKEGGLSCFLNQERVCGPDCMAFLPQVPEGGDYTGEQWAHCMLLVNAHRTGKHLVILTKVQKDAADNEATARADARRSKPAPGGG